MNSNLYQIRQVFSQPWVWLLAFALVLFIIQGLGTDSASKIPKLPPVLKVDAASHSGRYTVSWQNTPDLIAYYELQSRKDSGAWQSERVKELKKHERKVDSAIFHYRVRACNVGGCSPFTRIASIKVEPKFPYVVVDAEVVNLPVPSHENVGTVDGTAAVTGGSAQYTVDINVPLGRRGVQPQIKLVYSNQSRNGIVGMGWSLAAGSEIYRCPQAVAQDGQTRGIDFSKADRLCLEGQRLMLVSGVYGQPDSEYRTEIDSFARITLHGSSANASSFFQVETKEGRVSYYGADTESTNAVFIPEGAPSPLAWKLRHVEDRQGNSIHYSYGPSQDGHVLTEIWYTGVGQTLGNRKVRFSYDTNRSDVALRYLAGARISAPYRLSSISTEIDDKLVRRYELKYKISKATGRSLLARIRACSNLDCRGTNGLPWTNFSYQDDPVQFSEVAITGTEPGPANELRDIRLVNDYNGDGTRDMLYLEYPTPFGGTPSKRELRLSNRTRPIDLSNEPWLDIFDMENEGYPSYRDTDFDRDGVADLMGRSGGFLVIASWDGSKLVPTTTNLRLSSSVFVSEAVDFDSDGDTDLLVSESGAHRVHRNCTPRGETVIAFCDQVALPALASNEKIKNVADFDGNGLPDLYVDGRGDSRSATAKIIFTYPSRTSIRFVIKPLSALGGPGGSLVGMAGSGFLDINGDNLPDIFRLRTSTLCPKPVGCTPDLWMNHGGTFHKIMDVNGTISLHHRFFQAVFAMDYNTDGIQELMLPSELVTEWCYLFHLAGPDEDIDFCGEDFLSSHEAPHHLNRSIYRWDAVRFKYSAEGVFTVERVQTPITAPVYVSRVEDFFGDGLSDLRYRIDNAYADITGPGCDNPNRPRPPECTVARGRYIGGPPKGNKVARNFGAGTTQSKRPDFLDRARDGLKRSYEWEYASLSSKGSPDCMSNAPFYRAHRDIVMPHIFHFTSSMQVVTRLTEPNGIGGRDTTCYRYEDAMSSDEGRGFLGFRKIIEEDANTFDPHNDLRMTTEYYDTFPLTGRPKRSHVHLISDIERSTPLKETNYIWNIRCARGICFPYLTKRIERAYDLQSRNLISIIQTLNTYRREDLAYGNVSVIEVSTDDATATHRRRTEHDYDYSDAASWWVDKLERTTVTDEAMAYKIGPMPDEGTNGAKSVTAVIEYYPEDSTSRRLVRYETVQPSSTTERSRESFEYDAFGNLTDRAIDAANLASPRITQWTYSPDGFFIATEINAEGHKELTQFDAATGELVRKVTYGVSTEWGYDGFGRLLSEKTDGVPMVHRRLRWCDFIRCPALTRFHVVTVQDGSPIRREYLDELNRSVKTTRTAFGGVKEIGSVVEYDARGRMIRRSQPSTESDGTYFTVYSGYDALGRPGRKEVDRTGHSHNTFTTTYDYDGLTTRIVLGGELSASRMYNTLGNLVETVDTGGNPTRFRHDAHGNLILVQDAVDNRLVLQYNNLDQRVRINDPDQGEWHSEYNGVGDLLSQTSAKGKVLSFEYDGLQRLRKRFVNGDLHAEWVYDTTRLGVLDFERTGSSFQREYSYDELLRVTKVNTNVDGLEFTRKYAYDSYYGHVKGRKYPSGEVVALNYDAYGYSTGEENPMTPGKDFVYRKIQNRTAREQVSEETFGNGLKGLYQYVDSTGDTNHLQVMKDSTMVQNLIYAYEDPYGNLTRRENALLEVAEVFSYDKLQRLDHATRIRGGDSTTVDYDYDSLGNIVRKDDFATSYTYGNQGRNNAANAGPHAVASVIRPDGTPIADFAYDENGNMVAGNGRNISYDPFNKPIRIIEGTVLTNFSYGPNNALYKQSSSGRPVKTTYYIGGDYEYITTDGMVEEKTYMNGFLVITKSNAGRAVRYIHKDRLGSTDTITDQDGNVVERHGYDVFGKPLSSLWEDNGGLLHSGEFADESTMQGFTAHEHLDNHRLIHMGGRAYDPNLGRFLSVDPIIQNLSDSQAINPYSYIMNNPLSGVDPTGYQATECLSGQEACLEEPEEILPTSNPKEPKTNGKQGQGSVDLLAGVPVDAYGSVGGKPNAHIEPDAEHGGAWVVWSDGTTDFYNSDGTGVRNTPENAINITTNYARELFLRERRAYTNALLGVAKAISTVGVIIPYVFTGAIVAAELQAGAYGIYGLFSGTRAAQAAAGIGAGSKVGRQVAQLAQTQISALKNELFLKALDVGLKGQRAALARAQEALGRFRAGALEIPKGLTRQHLLDYRSAALRAIGNPAGTPAGRELTRQVQNARIQLIDAILQAGLL